jgi:AcrR family transcriptional regulator
MKSARKSKAGTRNAPLDAARWASAAFEALAAGGVEAVRVEPLAKGLGVTKGSFYWHFADRRALLDALLAQWSDGRIAAIREQAADETRPEAALRRLAELYTRHANPRGLAIELAIRSLARADDEAAKAARAVDLERLKQVARLFAGLGWKAADADARAVLFYSYLFGESLLDARAVSDRTRERAIEALLTPPS